MFVLSIVLLGLALYMVTRALDLLQRKARHAKKVALSRSSRLSHPAKRENKPLKNQIWQEFNQKRTLRILKHQYQLLEQRLKRGEATEGQKKQLQHLHVQIQQLENDIKVRSSQQGNQ